MSVALNFDQDFSENLSVNLGLSSFERAPDVVELFMNGPHLATGRFEVGNPNLDTETSNIGTWKRILESLGEKYTLSSEDIKPSSKIKKIIFPGIGNYGHVINNLKKNKIFFILEELINSDIPYLGVCIGMQI